MSKHRLRVGNVSRIVQRAIARHFTRTGMSAAEAQARGRRFTSHSGRVGFCVSATEAGVAPQHIAALARHASLAMVRRYGRRAELLRCAPHGVKGVGL